MLKYICEKMVNKNRQKIYNFNFLLKREVCYWLLEGISLNDKKSVISY